MPRRRRRRVPGTPPAPRGGAPRTSVTLPTFIVIGAMKCGTTSLHYYLGLHPAIAVSRVKELNFFVAERNWGRGSAWYERQFPRAAPAVGEASPNYTAYPRFAGVPERMHSLVPDARLIYVVRDPVERIVSHYVHQVASGLERRPFAEAVTDPDRNDYVARSRYRLQLERYLRYYPPERILVLAAEDLRRDRAGTLGQVFAWLGVDPGFESRRLRFELHAGERKRVRSATGQRLGRAVRTVLRRRLPLDLGWHAEELLVRPFSRPVPRPELPEALRSRLAEQLAPEAEWLRGFCGRDFEGWQV